MNLAHLHILLNHIPVLGVALGLVVLAGAAVRHHEVATSPVVLEAIPALAYLANQIGDPQVRNMGTIGGSLANNDPAADYPAAALALEATIVTNKRRIKAKDYFKGMFATASKKARSSCA